MEDIDFSCSDESMCVCVLSQPSFQTQTHWLCLSHVHIGFHLQSLNVFYLLHTVHVLDTFIEFPRSILAFDKIST